MQLNILIAVQQFMNRVTLTGTECNAYAACMNAIQADINALQARPENKPNADLVGEAPAKPVPANRPARPINGR